MNYTILEKQIIVKSAKETEAEIKRAVAPVERLIDDPSKGFMGAITRFRYLSEVCSSLSSQESY